MALFGLVTAFIVAVYAELEGNGTTRGATRTMFGGLLLTEWGMSLRPVVAFGSDLLELIPL